MKKLLVVCMLMTASFSSAFAATVGGEIFSSFSKKNFAFDRAVVSVAHTFDAQNQAVLAYDVLDKEVFLATISHSKLFLDTDVVTVGKQYVPYVALAEKKLGVRWLSPVFAVRSGFSGDRFTGLSYGGKNFGIGYVLAVGNDTPEKMAYSGLVSYQITPVCDAAVAYSKTSNETLVQALASGEVVGVKAVAEVAKTKFAAEGAEDVTGYGLSATRAMTSSLGVYASAASGDQAWKAKQGHEWDLAVGPTAVVTKGINAAALVTDKLAKAGDDNLGLTLKLSAAF